MAATTKTKNNDVKDRAAQPRRWLIFLGLLAAASLALLVIAIMQQRTPQQPLATVTIGETAFEAEIADNDILRTRGLMFRRELPERTGMLFIFDHPQIQTFWMRNTYLSLDIIFIDEQRRIVNIVTMPPLTDNTCQSERPAIYVLELEAGSAQKYNLHAGQEVRIQLPEKKD